MDLDLLIARRWFGSRTTIGEVYVNGVYQCYSLEDVVRPAGPMKHGGGNIAFVKDPDGYMIELKPR